MIDWILNRLEEGLSNEYYDKGKKEESIESLFLCKGCNTVWSIGKEGTKKITHYYYEIPKYGKKNKQCFYCKDNNLK